MKKRTLANLTHGDIVVALHGLRQIQRGRRPSLPYRNARNPIAAFRFAWLSWRMTDYIDSQRGRTNLIGPLRYVRPGVYTIDTMPADYNITIIDELIGVAFEWRQGSIKLNETYGYGSREIYLGPVMFEIVLDGVTVRIDKDSRAAMLAHDILRVNLGLISGPIGSRSKPMTPQEITEFNDAQMLQQCLQDRQRRLQAQT